MKYFAYGSNMNQEQMKERGIHFLERKHAILRGYRLEFNKLASRNPQEGYANIVPNENEIVEGILYEISDLDLPELDKYEGYHEHEEYPNHYNRIKVKVKLDDGQEIEATTYIANSAKVREGLKPSREYLNHLLEGKGILSETYYQKLKSWETLD